MPNRTKRPMRHRAARPSNSSAMLKRPRERLRAESEKKQSDRNEPPTRGRSRDDGLVLMAAPAGQGLDPSRNGASSELTTAQPTADGDAASHRVVCSS